MQTRAARFGVMVLAAFALGSADVSAQQQQTILSGAEISDLVDAHADAVAQDRSALRSFLQQERVREIAAAAGMDIRQLDGKAATLSAEDLAQIRPMLNDADVALAGEGLISNVIFIAGIIAIVLVLIWIL